MSKQLILPRVDKEGRCYISYSQIKTWKKSKREYMRQYFFGESGPDALKPYGEFGTKVGEALENNDFSEFTKKEQKFLKTVTRYDRSTSLGLTLSRGTSMGVTTRPALYSKPSVPHRISLLRVRVTTTTTCSAS